MPNWVYNRVSARGPAAALEAFVRDVGSAADDDAIDCELLAAEWNASDVVVVGDPASGRVDYAFQTASTPPVGRLAAASRAHPEVELLHEYLDERGSFAGRARWRAGVVVEQVEPAPDDFEWATAEEPGVS